MALQKINRQNVSDIVYQQLEACILEGTWKPGEKIPSENKLAEQMGVSRVTIRNAIHVTDIGSIHTNQIIIIIIIRLCHLHCTVRNNRNALPAKFVYRTVVWRISYLLAAGRRGIYFK